MNRMARLRDSRYRSTLVVVCLALGLSQGCVRSEPLKPATASASASGKPQLPFHPAAQPVSASEGTDPATSPDPKLPGDLPFPAASGTRVLPAGTLLTVQLESSLSAVKVHAGDAFAASVAAPLGVGEDTLVQRGAEVTGRVEAAQSRPGSGYVRLTLSAVAVDGVPVALQTSSLFARGTSKQLNVSSRSDPSAQESGGVRVPKGRRLTFRLTAPVTLNDSNLNDSSTREKPRSVSTTTQSATSK
jgi:hypothetical protein